MTLFRRLSWWWNRTSREAELAEEMAAHEAMKQADLMARGLPPEDAARQGRRAMGPATFMREEARAVWIWPWLERLAQDVRYALRSARKAPAFSFGVIGIMALGIGAATTVFSVVDGVLLRPLPYPNAAQLIYFDDGSHSPPRFRDWQRAIHSVERWAAAWGERQDFVGAGRPERLMTAQVSPDFFEVFGARPAVGRLFNAGDYEGDGTQVVLSGRFWHRRFGADPAVVGRRLDIGGRRVEVIGVLDDRFVEPDKVVTRPTDVWRPLVIPAAIANDRRYSILDVVGRLRPGVSVADARLELARVAPELFRQDPAVHGNGAGKPAPIPVLPLLQQIGRGVSQPLWLLLGAVGLMLLIACANVVNLYLARGTDRTRELAVRASLGAGRGRLTRQLITESITLGLIAGAIGLLLAQLGVTSLAALYPGELPRAGEIRIDGRVAVFAIVVSMLTATVAGLAPALRLKTRWLNEAIKTGNAEYGRTRTRSGLVVAEVALALVLLVGSALLFRSFLAIVNVAPGFAPEGLGVANLVLGDRFKPEQRTAFARALVTRVRAIPGMVEASAGVPAPMARFGNSRCCWSQNQITVDDGRLVETPVLIHPVGARYFETIGAAVNGRTVSDEEPLVPPYPVVVSANLAARLFGSSNPIGREFRGGRPGDAVPEPKWIIQGVVGDLHQFGLDQEVDQEIFVPYQQLGRDFDEIKVVFRTAGDPAGLVAAVRAAINEVDPSVPADDIVTMPQQIRRSLAQPRFYSTLMAAFGALALLLAAAGIYASLSYTVRQRSREMGIRVALGAQSDAIARMVVGGAGRLAAAGLVIGGLGAVGLGRALRGLLFGVGPTDSVAFLTAGIALGVTALVAAWLPAQRAGKADPLSVIRAD